MKISLERDTLLHQLQTVSRVASTRSAIQALSGVALAASSDGCELRATDMDVGLRVPLEAEVAREGLVVLPARLLVDVVRALPAAARSRWSCAPPSRTSSSSPAARPSTSARCGPRTSRPSPRPTPSPRSSLPAGAFVSTALKVAGSASRDETRPVLTGILVSASEHELRMVATDSYRLSVKETVLEAPLRQAFEVNVPARALQELARIAAHAGEEQLEVSVRQNQVLFVLGGVVLSSRLIDGQFPNYRQLLPETFEHELRVSSAELTDVVRRISLLAQKNAPLRLAFTEGELTVSAQTPDVGEAREALPIAFQGEAAGDRIQPRLPARRPGGHRRRRRAAQAHQPPAARACIEAADESRFQYLIMPIRLNV